MPPTDTDDPKLQALRATRTLHPDPDKVRHPLFVAGGFFDARDGLQVKYEALRAMQAEGYSLSQATRDFGLSRPTLYDAKSLFADQGLEGLLPHKSGPKAARKFTPEVVAYLQNLRSQQPSLPADQLAQEVQQRFRVSVHPRSIERALASDQEKKGRLNPPSPNQ